MSENNGKLDFAFTLFNAMRKDNVGYIYRGYFTQSITDNILALTESSLERAEPSAKIKKRVYSIMVECLQNITRHQEDAEMDLAKAYGIFVIEKKNERYYITTGNLIDNKNIPQIKKLLEKINSLDPEELKNYYKEVLMEGELSEKGGAGLGLIDMARKSGNKLSYDFKNISDLHSFFYLHTIPSLTKEGGDAEGGEDSLQNIIGIHEILNNENLLLIFNGNFNQETLVNLLSTVEGQMSGPTSFKKKIFYITVEMLQNIFKHGDSLNIIEDGNPGIFFISEKTNAYFITTGNYITKDKIEDLTTRVEYVNNLTKEELDDFYNKRLFNFDIDDNKKSGLGIIDLRLKSGQQLYVKFNDIDNRFAFFTLQAKIPKA
ncbi:MAG: hypothetical protein HY738_15415 [Bacteroidia bacterium]|nr:hypothetical protein [Bacteroidia bacterium]